MCFDFKLQNYDVGWSTRMLIAERAKESRNSGEIQRSMEKAWYKVNVPFQSRIKESPSFPLNYPKSTKQYAWVTDFSVGKNKMS